MAKKIKKIDEFLEDDLMFDIDIYCMYVQYDYKKINYE